MNTLLSPIALDETSHNVALLHRILEVLGLQVAKKEVDQSTAGPDTLEKVRALQKQLNVHIDDSTLVTSATAAAIARALEQRGLTAASRSFTITGAVRAPDGSAGKQQRLLAFDLDLRAVAVYRNLGAVAEIAKHGGFEFLGQALSDNRGDYRITFYDWQYRRAERKKADVVVYAVEEGAGGSRILGQSQLVHAEDYADDGLVGGLDITVAQTDTATEYEIVMRLLGAFLKESGVSLRDIASSREQLAFTAGELDLTLEHVTIAATAESLVPRQTSEPLSHELLYGLGRQRLALEWPVLFRKPGAELRAAIARSVEARIIQAFRDEQITAFLATLRKRAAAHVLHDDGAGGESPLSVMLSSALPEETHRFAFVHAVSTFSGDDPRDFWDTHLPAQPGFEGRPELVASLLLNQQLTALTGDHQALVKELQVNRKIGSIDGVLDLDESTWLEILEKTGVPGSIAGANEQERRRAYAGAMQSMVNAAFPTKRIARMAEKGQLPVGNDKIASSIAGFLAKTTQFDIASSRVHDFDAEIKAAAGEDAEEVKAELMKTQRVFQVSTSPEVMVTLLQSELHSAHAIAGIPRKSFVQTYGEALGGEEAALAVHQRASHVAATAEMAAANVLDYTHAFVPAAVLGPNGKLAIKTTVEKHVVNYSTLFGSSDLCECEHCRSVYSPAAYFVDLLRFLEGSTANGVKPKGKTPFDMLVRRRPDLLRLPLTCENTNTLVPYIDLANEVMEHYAAHDSLAKLEGHDTGDATAAELRANPQHFNLEAYKNIKDARHPFTLPYHQPLDVIRTYGNHFGVSRYEVMRAMNPTPDPEEARAIAAESLRLSEEEYEALTGEMFNGEKTTAEVHAYYGFVAAGGLEKLSPVPEFLRRTGLAYTDLVELLKTRFVNPHQGVLDVLQEILSYFPGNAAAFYAKLGKIEAGTLHAAADEGIKDALEAYDKAHVFGIGTVKLAAEFDAWVKGHLGELREVITLYEPSSQCDLEGTCLRTLEKVYAGSSESGLSKDDWSRTHRLIRLWRRLGWTLRETDLMLAALGDSEIGPTTVSDLESVSQLAAAAKLPLEQLTVLWDNIDTRGNECLYRKLFLSKAAPRINPAFKIGPWGGYLENPAEKLVRHRSTILAAFRLGEDDLDAILEVTRVIDGDIARPIDIDKDPLSLGNLSTIYRHAVLARALHLSVPELCKLITLFEASPFSFWDVQQKTFTNIEPDRTYEFYRLAESVEEAGFDATMLDYILKGELPADSRIGLDAGRARQAARAIREALGAIEQSHPEIPPAPLTAERLTAKLSLTFQPEIVARFMGLLDGTTLFEAVTDKKLDISFPDALAKKYTYAKLSGRLGCTGVMSNAERSALKGLAGVTPDFQAAVDALYDAPETFLADNFSGIFADLDGPEGANAILLGHAENPQGATHEARLAYVYASFIPVLKRKLRRDAATQHIAALIGLTDAAAGVLVAADIDGIIADLSTEGFSATYFGKPTWKIEDAKLARTDSVVHFAWGASEPVAEVPADGFGVVWESYIAAPATGDYTLVVDVEADDLFQLHLDGTLILERTGPNDDTSLEEEAALNSAQMHRLTLKYADMSDNAGVRLRWKTPTTGLSVIPAEAAYPAVLLDKFAATAAVYHRAAKLISGFALGEAEIEHLIAHAGDFDGIDFKALTAKHWKRLRRYTELRSAVPQARARLIDVFALAATETPAPTPESMASLVHLATAWDRANLESLIDHFNLSPAQFRDELALHRLHDAMRLAARTGLSAQTLETLGAVETDFETLDETAQAIKNAVKARYHEPDWLDVAARLNDELREHQKQALIAYLLTHPKIKAAGVGDADGLFEYFLIDVQMCACMDTSRIVQANASVQMFVNRCLLNLESRTENGVEVGVSPTAIARDQWAWMKSYRVWEANRKVFLYPENWLEPEWRADRSELFKDLESYLVQNDITDRSVEQAFRNYLTGLDELANLEVCGMCREDYPPTDGHAEGTLEYLHVFARTHNGPYEFFYRRWDEFRKWSAWERVPVDIRCVERGSHDSGVHLIPVPWKGRLFLFWPEFIEVQEPPPGNEGESVEHLSKKHASKLRSRRYLDIRLAWSERVNGAWAPKQVTKEFLRDNPDKEKDLFFRYSISTDGLAIKATRVRDGRHHLVGEFVLADIQSVVRTRTPKWVAPQLELLVPTSDYVYAYSRRQASSECHLELDHDVYLSAEAEHDLLPLDTYQSLDIQVDDPFFFKDAHRTYFVRPVLGPPSKWLKSPGKHAPLLPGLNGGAGQQKGKATLDTVLEFHTFHHPKSGEFVERLNRDGVPELMESDTYLKSDDDKAFYERYLPTSKVLKAPAKRTFYKENVCFDPYGANSLYNWELFFHAPLYIATRLSRNGKYEEAMKWFHYIFDPTSDETPGPGELETSRYWKVRPFKTTPSQRLEDWFLTLAPNAEDPAIAEWRENPFDPHRVAANRPLAYMKHVVLAYVENLVAWGDSLFRQFTMESVNEALQLYVITNHILGPRPQIVPKRGEIKAESYESLRTKLDAFSNAVVALENVFPYSSDVPANAKPIGANILGVGKALYFCVPPNDKLLERWDTVADRLYKIRHCQDLGGAERKLALFAPPIDPGALVQAAAQGLSLGSILADLSSPPPIYRFSFLLQKANELCGDVKALGNALLVAIEKKDAEELGRLRASQETQMLELVTAIRERQVLEARASKESLVKTRETAKFRLEHYVALLGDDSITVPSAPSLSANLTAESQLPDTTITTLETDVDEALAGSDERGVKLIAREKLDLEKSAAAMAKQNEASKAERLSGLMNMIPNFSTQVEPFGIGVTISFGGSNIGAYFSAKAQVPRIASNVAAHEASQAAKMASYIRREQDWTLQANLAAKEIVQLDKQIISADIRIQIAEKELKNHKKQIENARQVEQFLRDKFTGQELYQWMREQLYAVYKQSYNLTFEMAKRAERAYQYELGTETASFIQYGYWDDAQQGLMAGDKLQLALRQLERSYLDENRRDLELTKRISLARLDPLALIELRETGTCRVSLPEELFDLDFRGHYFRRIQSVSLSIPCVAGPYTSVSGTLRLVNNSVRINTSMNGEGTYEHENDQGLWIDDDRFRTSRVPVTAIATSTAQNDSGMFELSFRDERYLPFEGAGAVSEWQLELSADSALRQFDHATISDVILHMSYTAREGGGTFKKAARDYIIETFLTNEDALAKQPLMQMLSMKDEFPTEWHRLLHPAKEGAEQILSFTVGRERFPFFVQAWSKVIVTKIEVFARCAATNYEGNYHMVLSYVNPGEEPSTSAQSDTMKAYGDLNKATFQAADAGPELDELDVAAAVMGLKLKRSSVETYTSLGDELKNVFMVLHYKLEKPIL